MFQLRTKMWNFLPGYERKTNNKYSEDSLEKKRRKKKRRNKRRLKALAFLKNVLLLTSIIYTYQWLNSITQIKPTGNVAVNKLLSQSPLKHQHWAVQRPGLPRQMQKDLQIWVIGAGEQLPLQIPRPTWDPLTTACHSHRV